MDFARQVKSSVKSAIANLLYWTGALSLLARRRLKGRAIVLMYHRVLPAELASRSFSHPGIIVTPETFAKHMDFLKRKFRPLSLGEFQQHLESGTPFPDGTCLVTFDDGWVDNHDYALPILREHGIPAVVFVATDYLDSDQPFWQEHLGHLLYQASCRGLGESVLRSCDISLPPPEDDASLRQLIADTVTHFREEPYENIESAIETLIHLLKTAGLDHGVCTPDQFMTWRQVESLAETGITIASHSSSHRFLTRLDEATVRTELAKSHEALQARLGLATCSLAYPGGRHDDCVRRSAIDAGYRLGFTTKPGRASVESHPLLIPRVNIHESSTNTIPLFLSKVLGVF